MIRVISWNNGAAARALSEKVSNGKLLRSNCNKPIPSCDFLINLGCSSISRPMSGVQNVLNWPVSVASASSKVKTFALLGDLCPESWTDKSEAEYYSLQTGDSIVCRTVDNGHSGAGIVVVSKDELLELGSLPDAHLYVKAVPKRREYRVHVGLVNGAYKIIDVCRKVRRASVDDTDRPFVWNHDNDFIFQRSGVTPDTVPHPVIIKAIEAFRSLGLHFGAVDVIVQSGGPLAEAPVYVLEVNTSPGMEGTTLERYAEYFKAVESRSEFRSWTTMPVGFGEEYADE